MSDAQKVYTKVLAALKQTLSRTSQRHLTVMALMISTMVRKGTCSLTQIARATPSKAKLESITRRFQRFVANSNIHPETIMLPFTQQILRSFQGKQLHLALDVSCVGRGCLALMIGIVYKGRLLPLIWEVAKGKKGHWSSARHVAFAKKAFELIGERDNVVILGDGEYDNVPFLRYVAEECGWNFVVRTAKNTLIGGGPYAKQLKHELPVKEGETLWRKNTVVTADEFGPVHVVAHWKTGEDKPWYLLSSFSIPQKSLDFYRKRFVIETFFSDQKSRGFKMDKSRIECPERLSRLLMLCCLSYLWMIYLGVRLVAMGKVDLVDRSLERQDKSLFQIGLSWLERLLTNGKHFPVRFALPRQLVLSDVWLSRHWLPNKTVM